MGRAYGQRPSELLGVAQQGSMLRLMIDAAAHELGTRKLLSIEKAFPNIDLGTVG